MFKKLQYLIIAIFFSCSSNDSSPIVSDPGKELVFEYKQVWSDEFNGNDVDRNNWSFILWNAGKVNNEWQQYVENTDNYKVENGSLHIIATKTGDNGFGGYTSTRLSSKLKQEFKYGRIELRAKMPQGKGTWAALWMLGSNHDEIGWPNCGEIDILEYVGHQSNTIHNNIHTQDDYNVTNNGSARNLASVEEAFHTYGITWTNTKIEFYLDDPTNIINTYAPSNPGIHNWPFAQKFYLILNLAVGGTWGGKEGVDGTIWPQTMEVDYVKIYQLKLVE
jgi:beta-glucanase (GH16 family)